MKQLLSIILLFILLLCTSCNDSSSEMSMHIMKEWASKEVFFSENAKYIVDMDTICLSINSYQLKIVNYTDSSGCYSCRLKLKEWNEFIEGILPYTNNKLLILNHIAPKRVTEALYELKSTKYHYPVCIDLNGEFDNINHFPKNNAFHCFLLDENNRVILIGNPVHNSKIKDLYIRTICERLGIKRQKESIGSQRIINSLGVFSWQTEQHTSFVVNNDSDEPMHIDSLYTSCECTTALIDKTDIAPHEKAIVNVTFKADKSEQFTREIYADVSGGEQIVMVIEGEAIE